MDSSTPSPFPKASHSGQPSQPPRLLDQVRLQAQRHGLSPAIAQEYADWIRRFLLFHGKRHPRELGAAEAGQFLQHLADTEADPLPRVRQAGDALDFLYGNVLCLALAAIRPPRMPRLLDQLRQELRLRHYSLRTEECYVRWAIRFILFQHKRHPRDMGAAEVEQFLTDLAVNGHVSASTQNQALNALVFLYTQVLGQKLDRIDAARARRPRRLPVVLTPDEVRQVLDHVAGCGGLYQLMARLLYGSGLRLMECCRVRLKDVDLSRGQVIVRQGKGDKDRVVMLPQSLRPALARPFDARRRLHERDLHRGVAHVELPDALERKYPSAARELGWQFLFASRQLARDPRGGVRGRHHLHPGAIHRAVTLAVRQAGLIKRASCHTFRHSFATHLLERGHDIRVVQAVPC